MQKPGRRVEVGRQIVREQQGLLSRDVCSSAFLIPLWKSAAD